MAHRLGVDVGGTFTDLLLVHDESGAMHRVKTPSTPGDPSEGVLVGVRRISDEAGTAVADIRNILHGTTVATNAVLESKGARVGLLTTVGFKQILHLARSQTPGPLAGWIIMIKPDPPASLADTREIVERMDARGNTVTPVDVKQAEEAIRDLVESGVETLTIGFINSYISSRHEEEVGEIVERLYPGFPVTLSSHVLPEFREYERTLTACMNSYVRPKVASYVEQLQSELKAVGATADVNILRSDAGLMTTREAARNPIYGVLSGPSGGVAGALYVARKAGYDNILTFDMGGTSTDVSLCLGGAPTIGRETAISHFRLRVPSVDVHTVGAGGGSIAHVPELTKALRVGPQSAGAEPGPAAYGKGGTDPTVTDANVVVGHLPPRLLGGEMQLDAEAAADGGAGGRRRHGPAVGRGRCRGHPRHRQREHGRGAARRLRPARPRPARVRARCLWRGGADARERRRADHGLVPGDRAPGAGPALRARGHRGGLPRRVRPHLHPRARRRRAGGRLEHPRRARRAGPAMARERGHRRGAAQHQLRGRHALSRPGLRDPREPDARGGALGRPRRARPALQRAPRAALRLPHVRDAERDRQPPRRRLRGGAQARAARGRARVDRTHRPQ